jgi:hypothetical protein
LYTRIIYQFLRFENLKPYKYNLHKSLASAHIFEHGECQYHIKLDLNVFIYLSKIKMLKHYKKT